MQASSWFTASPGLAGATGLAEATGLAGATGLARGMGLAQAMGLGQATWFCTRQQFCSGCGRSASSVLILVALDAHVHSHVALNDRVRSFVSLDARVRGSRPITPGVGSLVSGDEFLIDPGQFSLDQCLLASCECSLAGAHWK